MAKIFGTTLGHSQSIARRRRRAAPHRSAAVGEALDYGPLAEWLGFHIRMTQIASFQAKDRAARPWLYPTPRQA